LGRCSAQVQIVELAVAITTSDPRTLRGHQRIPVDLAQARSSL